MSVSTWYISTFSTLYFLKIERIFSSGKQNVFKTLYMKLISKSLANMSILPDKNLVVTFMWSFLFTAKDLVEADSQSLNSRIILVFLESTASWIFESMSMNFLFFFLPFLRLCSKESTASKTSSILFSRYSFLAWEVGSFLFKVLF